MNSFFSLSQRSKVVCHHLILPKLSLLLRRGTPPLYLLIVVLSSQNFLSTKVSSRQQLLCFKNRTSDASALEIHRCLHKPHHGILHPSERQGRLPTHHDQGLCHLQESHVEKLFCFKKHARIPQVSSHFFVRHRRPTTSTKMGHLIVPHRLCSTHTT